MQGIQSIEAQLHGGAFLPVVKQDGQQGYEREPKYELGAASPVLEETPQAYDRQLGHTPAAAEIEGQHKEYTHIAVIRVGLDKHDGHHKKSCADQGFGQRHVTINYIVQHRHCSQGQAEGIEHIEAAAQYLHMGHLQFGSAHKKEEGQVQGGYVRLYQQNVGCHCAEGESQVGQNFIGKVKAEIAGTAVSVIDKREGQGKGNLGEQGKQKEPGQVALPVGSLLKAVDQQKSIYRKGYAPYGAHKIVYGRVDQVIGAQKKTGVVHDHGGKGNYFQ